MQIIPVLDLMGGLVVRGVMGDRANYRPIESRLVASAEPLDVMRALRDLGGFRFFYIADLDAIEGRGSHAGVVAGLAKAFPEVGFWVDAGLRNLGDVKALLAQPFVCPVIGSESVDGLKTVEAVSREPRAVLSLDYRGDAFVGPQGLAELPSIWPNRVIAMTLAKVGSGAGPDFERLASVRALADRAPDQERAIFAAGGVRDSGDLFRLRDAGLAGVLVASALHDGWLDRATLASCGD